MADQSTKIYDLIDAVPEAIVVHCSDPRFQRAFAGFIKNELQLEEGKYIPLVVSGGVGSLSEPFMLPKEFRFMKERLRMFLERFDSVKLIVLINHEDCRHYDWLRNFIGKLFLQRFHNMAERQQADLKKVAKAILELAAMRIETKLYYAKFANPSRSKVVFEEVK
ncbi:MAG: hypothetical protein ACREOI_13815 [bacterium]